MEPFSNRRILQQALADWRGRGRLSAEALTQAWQPTLPTRADWHDWLERALLMLGVALVCAGVIVFFAFNWAALHKFTRFGLLAAALTLLAGFAALRLSGSVRAMVARDSAFGEAGGTPSTGAMADAGSGARSGARSTRRSHDSDDMAARAALAAAQIVSGVLMAVIGQTYQTGADAWQLFALWTLLATPWALAARAAPHWWIVLAVGNVALLRYGSVQLGVGGMLELLFTAERAAATMRLLLGAALAQLVLWYVLAAHAPAWGFRGQTGPRLLALLACAYAGWVGLMSVFSHRVDIAGAGLALAVLAGFGAWFRWRRFDIVVLSVVCLTAIGLIVAWAGRWLSGPQAGFGVFLVLTVLTVGLAAMAGSWLMRAWHAQARSPA